MVDDGKHRTAGAGFWIGRGEDEAVDAGVDHSAGAHCAWLKSNVERAAVKAVIVESRGGGAHGDDFGVGGGVVVAKDAILAAGYDGVFVDDDGADGDFAGFRGQAGLGEGGLDGVFRMVHYLEYYASRRWLKLNTFNFFDSR